MTVIIKIKEIEIENLKNIKHGKISTGIGFEDIDKSAVIGIYGQNGSGKTAAMESLSVLKKILTLQPLPENSHKLIYYNEKAVRLSFQVILTNKFGEYSVFYELTLQSGKERLSIVKEKLSYKENIKRKRHKILIEKDGNKIYIKNKQLNDFNEESRIKILLANEMSMENYTSFIFNDSLSKVYEWNLNKEEYELLNNIRNDFNMNFHIISDIKTGLVLANILMPFSVHLDDDRGEIPYDLNKPMVLPQKLFQKICKVIEQINIVLERVVPGLKIVVKELNNETMDDGNQGVRFEFLSQKEDKMLPLRSESAGILKLISILSTLIAVYNKHNSCVVIDELDSGIFEYLLGEILEIINDNGKGQLFFTSHNLRALEVLPYKNLLFTTSNEDNRFTRLKGVRKLSNSRDIYIRAVQLGGQNENLYLETDNYDIKKSFRKAGAIDV